jgi:hypothetical protein
VVVTLEVEELVVVALVVFERVNHLMIPTQLHH